MEDKNSKNIVIMHSVQNWLPITQTWIYNQLKYLAPVESVIFTNAIKNLDLFPWTPIYQTGKVYDIIFRAMRKFGIGFRYYPSHLDQAITKHEPIVLHSHFGNRGWYNLPLAKKHALKHIVTFYGYDVNKLPVQQPVWQKRFQELFRQVDLILCEGPHMAECVKNLGCPNEKVKVHRLGVDIDKTPFKARELEKSDEIRILIAGAFREKKGIPYALKAIGKLKPQYPNLRVTIIGDATVEKESIDEKRIILETIERNGLQSVTRLLGFQPHETLLAEAYKHHIFLSPSVTASNGDTEGGAPVSIIEMLATGMPVVSTRHCDIPQIILQNVTGLLARERDVDDLVVNLKMVIDDPAKAKVLSENGRTHVEKKYNLLCQTERLREIYFEFAHKG